VVTDEVRKLAASSKDASTKISNILSSIQEKTNITNQYAKNSQV